MSGGTSAAMIALTAVSAIGKMSAASAQADAAVTQGNQEASNQVIKTDIQAGQATAGFLSSGFTFAGTAKAAVNDIYATGITDVNRINSNAKTTATNDIAAGRSAAIAGIASTAGMAAAGGSMGAMFDASPIGQSTAYSLNNSGFGNTAYDMLQKGDAYRA